MNPEQINLFSPIELKVNDMTISMNKTLNNNLHKAKREQNDEFYTQSVDVERELYHYRDQFKGKTILCNCDDPEWSSFYQYFRKQFRFLGLKKLISTHYSPTGAYALITTGNMKDVKKPLDGDGDFRSPECMVFLNEADIIVSNPPFSLFREYVASIIGAGKQFIILGSTNAITYKDIWKEFQAENIWLGVNNKGMWFRVPDHYTNNSPASVKWEDGVQYHKLGNISWFTNMEHSRRREELPLAYSINDQNVTYPTYDGYEDIINVDKLAHIPHDYDGLMGVPITFMAKHNPAEFEIMGIANSARFIGHKCITIIEGRKVYNRVIIRKVKGA